MLYCLTVASLSNVIAIVTFFLSELNVCFITGALIASIPLVVKLESATSPFASIFIA
ncbi:hypothetical protein D3C73_1559630 [compost metagenome]